MTEPVGGADDDVLRRIDAFVAEERELRDRHARGELTTQEERARMQSVERALDQCWDLLRQRRARREYGADPDGAQARPAGEVEGYWQ